MHVMTLAHRSSEGSYVVVEEPEPPAAELLTDGNDRAVQPGPWSAPRPCCRRRIRAVKNGRSGSSGSLPLHRYTCKIAAAIAILGSIHTIGWATACTGLRYRKHVHALPV